MQSVEHKGTFTIIILPVISIGGYLLHLSSNKRNRAGAGTGEKEIYFKFSYNRRKIINQIIESRNTEAKQDKNKTKTKTFLLLTMAINTGLQHYTKINRKKLCENA